MTLLPFGDIQCHIGGSYAKYPIRSPFNRGQTLHSRGVNSPVRAFKAVDGNPPFIARAEQCWLWDEDGNRFLDLIGSWGPMIVGHAHPVVQEAILDAAQSGTSFGAPTAREVHFCQSTLRSTSCLGYGAIVFLRH